MRKLAVAMAKGGVGKTTTAVNLSHGLAMLGYKVLLVDCDTQGQAAKFLGVSPRFGLFEFLTGSDASGQAVPRKEAVHPSRENLWLLAGGIKLVELKNWLGEQPRETRQMILRDSLIPRDGMLDFLIFDCAPGLDVLSANILMASTEVLCPVSLQAASVEGLKTFFSYLLSAQQMNQELELKYILPTMFDKRTRQSFEFYRHLKKLFVRQICDPIHHNVRLSEATAYGKTIFEYRNSASGAKDYRKLIRRIENHGVEPKRPS